MRKIGEVAGTATDVVFWDDETLLAVDADVAVWCVGIDGAHRTRVAARLDVVGAGQVERESRLAPRLACHAPSAAIVVNTELYQLFGRIGEGPWRQVLDNSTVFFPDRLTFAPDGGRLLVTGTDMLVVVDPAGVLPEVHLQTAPDRGSALFGAWTGPGRLLAYDREPGTGADEWYLDDVSAWPAPRMLSRLDRDHDVWGDPVDLASGPGGEFCVVALSQGWLAWYSLPSLELLDAVSGGSGRVDFGGLTATSDGRIVAVEAGSGVQLWDTATRQPLADVGAGWCDPRLSPSGHRLAARSADAGGAWSIWELSDRRDSQGCGAAGDSGRARSG